MSSSSQEAVNEANSPTKVAQVNRYPPQNIEVNESLCRQNFIQLKMRKASTPMLFRPIMNTLSSNMTSRYPLRILESQDEMPNPNMGMTKRKRQDMMMEDYECQDSVPVMITTPRANLQSRPKTSAGLIGMTSKSAFAPVRKVNFADVTNISCNQDALPSPSVSRSSFAMRK